MVLVVILHGEIGRGWREDRVQRLLFQHRLYSLVQGALWSRNHTALHVGEHICVEDLDYQSVDQQLLRVAHHAHTLACRGEGGLRERVGVVHVSHRRLDRDLRLGSLRLLMHPLYGEGGLDGGDH